jgi:OOP family OmpA-OmpF porin
MIKSAKHSLLLAALLGLSVSALAQTKGIDRTGTVGYAIDQRDNVVKSGFGLCWRTGYWTPAMAIEECDPDLVKKAPMAAPCGCRQTRRPRCCSEARRTEGNAGRRRPVRLQQG